MKLSCACLLVSSLLVQVSCMVGPPYREVRRQAPGGGWYVERVPIAPGERAAAPARPGFHDDSWWKGDHLSGSPSMTINLSEQRIYYYKAGQLAGVSTISSGREGYSTPTGSFKITQKNRDHKSSLYGNYVDAQGNILQKEVDVRKDPKPPGARFDGADMRYFMRVTGAVGMHEGYLPGIPGLARLHPPATAHGPHFLPRDAAGHAGEDRGSHPAAADLLGGAAGAATPAAAFAARARARHPAAALPDAAALAADAAADPADAGAAGIDVLLGVRPGGGGSLSGCRRSGTMPPRCAGRARHRGRPGSP